MPVLRYYGINGNNIRPCSLEGEHVSVLSPGIILRVPRCPVLGTSVEAINSVTVTFLSLLLNPCPPDFNSTDLAQI